MKLPEGQEPEEINLEEEADKLISRRQALKGVGSKAMGVAFMLGLGTMMFISPPSQACCKCQGSAPTKCQNNCQNMASCGTVCFDQQNTISSVSPADELLPVE